jgi:hypothetical protein
VARYRKFGDLIRDTPSLRAYQGDMAERFVDLASEVLAARFGFEPTDPEPQVAAAAVLGLWRVQFSALGTQLRPGRPIQEALDAAAADVRCAAELIETGLGAFLNRTP